MFQHEGKHSQLVTVNKIKCINALPQSTYMYLVGTSIQAFFQYKEDTAVKFNLIVWIVEHALKYAHLQK